MIYSLINHISFQLHGTFKRIILRSKAQRRSSNGQKRKTKKQEKIIGIRLTDLQKKEQKRDLQNGLTMDSYRSQTPQEWVTRGNNSSNDMDVFAVVKDMMPNQNNAYESDDVQFNLSKYHDYFELKVKFDKFYWLLLIIYIK